jgi:hypothetical protein
MTDNDLRLHLLQSFDGPTLERALQIALNPGEPLHTVCPFVFVLDSCSYDPSLIGYRVPIQIVSGIESPSVRNGYRVPAFVARVHTSLVSVLHMPEIHLGF